MYGVTITEIINKLNLQNMTPEIDTDKIVVSHPDVNRPALQLTGFFEHFDNERVQIIGFVEQAYLSTLPKERKREIYDRLLACKIPCLIYSRNMGPDEDMLEMANHYGVPCLVSSKSTSDLMAEVIRWLNVKLAPCISIHGVLVDVFGEGVLITGESGIGKSEAALELIKRGHRLVSDDVVEIRKVSDETLIGSVVVGGMNWQAYPALGESYDAMVKLRYRSRPCACIIEPEDDQRVSLALRSPQPTTAPGQYAVLYDGDTVLGGGMIEEVMHA